LYNFGEMLYPRILEKEILRYLPEKEALIILGARQVGKTSLMLRIKSKIEKEVPCFYFDLEKPQDLEKVEAGCEELLQFLEIQGASRKKRNVVFIDEVHYLSDPAKFIKLMVDHYSSRVKLIVSGSSNLEIKKKFKESMMGRKFTFHLYPLNFYEFLIFKKRGDLAKLLPQNSFLYFSGEDKTRFFLEEYKRYFLEFIIFGGYPRVAISKDIELKQKILEEITVSYILKDIRSLFQIEDIAKFNRLVKLLAINSANLLNINSLSSATGIPRYLTSQYVTVLENTYLIELLPPYFTNKKKEVVKAHKVYFLDNGLRNYLTGGNLYFTEEREDIGTLLEAAVFSGLKKKKGEVKLYFWRTQNKAEVDFVLEHAGKLHPVEVNRAGKPPRALYTFMDYYKTQRGYVAYAGRFSKKNKIYFVPLWWLG